MPKLLAVASIVVALAGCRRSAGPPHGATPTATLTGGVESSLSSLPAAPSSSEYRRELPALRRVIEEIEPREVLWIGAMAATWEVKRHPSTGIVLSRMARVGFVVRDGSRCWYREAHVSNERAGGEWLAPKLTGWSIEVHRLPVKEGKPPAPQTREVGTTTEIQTEVGIDCRAV